MNRKIFAKLLPFLLLPCLFLMACTSPYSDKAGTVSTLRAQIKLSYEYCEAGTLYSWTTPAGLKEIADEFYISTLSSLSASSSDFKAKVVDIRNDLAVNLRVADNSFFSYLFPASLKLRLYKTDRLSVFRHKLTRYGQNKL